MTAFYGTTQGAIVRPRELYRVSYGATPGGLTLDALTLGLFRQSLAAGMDRLYNGGLAGTGLAYPASAPAVAPGAVASTMDIRINASLPAGTVLTAAALARKLDELATAGGGRYTLLRLELLTGGESSAEAQRNRDKVTADLSEKILEARPHYSLLEGLSDTYKTAVYIMAGGVVLYLLVSTGAISKGITEAKAIRKAARR